MVNAGDREQELAELFRNVQQCRRCPLGESRTNVVFGSGSAGARIMFVGEAPGYHEDQQGLPFVGQAGKLLEKLLARIGLTRQDVYIANVLKCRPPGNRDPQPEEIDLCRSWLDRQISVIEPVAICTLGNFSTKLLSGKPDGITRVRGRQQPFPGNPEIRLFPVFHPAAALYTPANLTILDQDFDTLGEIIGSPAVEPEAGPVALEAGAIPEVQFEGAVRASETQTEPEQLGLF